MVHSKSIVSENSGGRGFEHRWVLAFFSFSILLVLKKIPSGGATDVLCDITDAQLSRLVKYSI